MPFYVRPSTMDAGTSPFSFGLAERHADEPPVSDDEPVADDEYRSPCEDLDLFGFGELYRSQLPVAPSDAKPANEGTSGDAAPSAVAAVDSEVTSVKRHSKQDAIDTMFGIPIARAGVPAIVYTAPTRVKKHCLKQAKISAFVKDQRPVAATVDTSAPSDNMAPGFLVLSRMRHDGDEGLWVLELALFREGYP